MHIISAAVHWLLDLLGTIVKADLGYGSRRDCHQTLELRRVSSTSNQRVLGTLLARAEGMVQVARLEDRRTVVF